MKRYVLCKHSLGQTVFVSGDPRAPSFEYSGDRAAAFPSPEEASACRASLSHQLGGGAEEYRVYEVQPDGHLVPAES